MSVPRTAIVAIVALAIGLALGLVLGDKDHEPGADRGPAAVSVTPDGRPGSARPADPAPSVRTPRRHVATGVDQLVEQVVAAIDAPEVPVGTGRIDGRVTTRSGKALTGVDVTVSMITHGFTGGRAWKDLTVAERVTVMVQQGLLQQATTRTTTTDGEGRYEFTNLPHEPHSVAASSPSYQLVYSRSSGGWIEPDATVGFVGDPVVEVEFVLTLDDGREPERATVSFVGGRGVNSGYRWTPSDRSIRMTPGTFHISVTAGDAQEFTASLPRLTLAHGEPTDAVHLQLRAPPGIVGRLVQPAGFAAGWVHVGAQLVGPDTTPETVAAGRRLAAVQQGVDARFTILDLPPGRYLVVAWEPSGDNRILATREIDVADEQVHVELVAAGPRREDYLELVVRGPDGEALAGFQVQLQVKREHWHGTTSRQPIERPDGSFWVRHVDASHARPDGNHRVIVSHPSWGRARREYRPGPAAHAEVTFEEPAFVDVRVAGASTELVAAGVTVMAKDADGGGASARASAADGDVVARLGPMQPGPFTLDVGVESNRRRLVVAQQQIIARAGENAVTLGLPSLHTLRIELEDTTAVPGRGVWLNPVAEDHPTGKIHASFPASGVIVHRFLPAGTYELRSGPERREITVPGTSHIRF